MALLMGSLERADEVSEVAREALVQVARRAQEYGSAGSCRPDDHGSWDGELDRGPATAGPAIVTECLAAALGKGGAIYARSGSGEAGGGHGLRHMSRLWRGAWDGGD